MDTASRNTPPAPIVPFDGQFTGFVRQKLREKRIDLGLPYQRIARFFGINWATFRKWELGPTEACELCFRPRLEAFLNGDYDVFLRSQAQIRKNHSCGNMIPGEIRACLERISNAYRLCQERPDLRDELVQTIDQATTETMSNLIEPHSTAAADDAGRRRSNNQHHTACAPAAKQRRGSNVNR